MMPLPSTADVVVVGGGVIGAATLYALTAAGCSTAVLLERETIASGSTSKAAGGIRAQFSDDLNIRMALENIRRFERFGVEFGVDIGFNQWGYLFLLGEDDVEPFESAVSLQQSLGVPSEILTPEEAQLIVPQISVDDVATATFCPIDGYANPETVALAYASAAVKLGATIVQGCEVAGINSSAGRVTGVTSSRGAVSAGAVVLAAGVWSSELAAAVGLGLPVVPEKRHVWLTDLDDPLPRELPLTIDFPTGFYFQREGDRLVFGGRPATLEELAPAAMGRLPVLADLGIRPGWWGYYAMSPDRNAIIGAAADPLGLLYATGFSGHGFQQAPVVGEHLADLALGREPRFDLSPLSVERFAEDSAKPESHVI